MKPDASVAATVRGDMLAKIELVSFHVGLLFLATILYFIIALAQKDATAQLLKPELILSFSVVVAGSISWLRKAYSSARWAASKPHFSSIVLALGHIGPAYAAWMSYQMFSAGQASGVVYAFAGMWSLPCYLLGVILCMIHLR